LACAYCVCHQDHGWHHHPEQFVNQPTANDLIDALLDQVFATDEGQAGFPISLCDYSDPFIPVHRARVLSILNALIDRNASNMVYITTKVHPGLRFLQQLQATLARPNALRVTVFVSLPPLKACYEQVSVAGRVRLLQDLARLGIPCCWYLRPLVEEWFDEDQLLSLARQLLPHIGQHVILSGIVMSEEIETMLTAQQLVIPAWDRNQPGRKLPLAPAFEQHIRQILQSVATEQRVELGPVMGHRLCGTNGNHAYGCLICAKQDRYCQLFQLHHYGSTVESIDNQRLKETLRRQQYVMQLQQSNGAGVNRQPTIEDCM
jgi:DNA repair photolyase